MQEIEFSIIKNICLARSYFFLQENNCLARIGICLARKIFLCKNCKSKILQISQSCKFLVMLQLSCKYLQVSCRNLQVLLRWFYLGSFTVHTDFQVKYCKPISSLLYPNGPLSDKRQLNWGMLKSKGFHTLGGSNALAPACACASNHVSVRSYTKSMHHKRVTVTTHSPRFFCQ